MYKENNYVQGTNLCYNLIITITMMTVILLATSLILVVSEDKPKQVKPVEVSTPIKKHISKPLTDKVLLEYIKELHIKFPRVVLAQAKLESGNYKSHVFNTKKNLFGMKLAASRPTIGKGKANEYAHYNSWKESVIDYAFLQTTYYRNCRTEEQYLNQLQRSYCENNKYIQHLRELMK